MLPSIMARREAAKQKAYEAILVNQKGFVTEGTISNIFVVKNGKLITPKEDILEGTVRNLIIKKTPVKLVNITQKQLYSFDEVFVTSSVKGVVPVAKIDGKKVGDGKVGPITKLIINAVKKSL
jgi:branched-subunit amino acid aminotransferase/4-amino-4-deoxychorismate lyase